jgi:hypothetical protein
VTPVEAPAEPVRVPGEAPRAGSDVLVEYSDEAPVLVRGTASGRLYTFSAARPTRIVAAADVPQLLRNPQFRRVAAVHR